jgi:hypothetical protein
VARWMRQKVSGESGWDILSQKKLRSHSILLIRGVVAISRLEIRLQGGKRTVVDRVADGCRANIGEL